MKRGRGFIYSTSATSNNPARRIRRTSGQQTQAGRSGEGTSQFRSGGIPSHGSPRKRQRSPEAIALSTSTRVNRGGYDARQGIKDVRFQKYIKPDVVCGNGSSF